MATAWTQPAAEPEAAGRIAADTSPPVMSSRNISSAGRADAGRSRATSQTHIDRLQKTLEITPPGGPDKRILEMGAYLQITPALKSKLGYGEVRGCYYGTLGEVDHKAFVSDDGERFDLRRRSLRCREGPFPVSGRVLRYGPVLRTDRASADRSDAHDGRDQPHSEARRPSGASRRRTSARSGRSQRFCRAIIPGFFPPISGHRPMAPTTARATPANMRRGRSRLFSVTRVSKSRCSKPANSARSRIPNMSGCEHLLEHLQADPDLRGDGLYAVGVKRGPFVNAILPGCTVRRWLLRCRRSKSTPTAADRSCEFPRSTGADRAAVSDIRFSIPTTGCSLRKASGSRVDRVR